MNNDEDEILERRNAELEFVSSAYSQEEAWFEQQQPQQGEVLVVDDNGSTAATIAATSTIAATTSTTNVYRVLCGRSDDVGTDNANKTYCFILILHLPKWYPLEGYLKVSGKVTDKDTATSGNIHNRGLRGKTAHNNALPHLIESCQQLAKSLEGQEAIFSVFNHAEEWMTDEWPKMLSAYSTTNLENNSSNQTSNSRTQQQSLIICRNLIYSHHIIGKRKRCDILSLTQELQLTGFCKIGWPGIIIIEGIQESCIEFYNTIRRWTWQYLSLRGETAEEIRISLVSSSGHNDIDHIVNSKRLFPKFAEVEDMSIVASHCKAVGLESLFLTSMKMYNNNDNDESIPSCSNKNPEKNNMHSYYGALIHVDHMNDGKSYRKWLRKVCYEQNVLLLIKQCYPNQDFTRKPIILVGLIGTTIDSVSVVLKRWRTSKVDVDAKGKPCYERMMSVLTEGNNIITSISEIDHANNADNSVLYNSEGKLNTTKEKLFDLIESIGGKQWSDVVMDNFSILPN